MVAGGRGVGSAENFSVVEALADSLGAAVGASRAAVDSGYPGQFLVVDRQDGVAPAPTLPWASPGAISTALAYQTSKTIIAVSKDERGADL